MNKKLGMVLVLERLGMVLVTAFILSMMSIVSASYTYTEETVMLNMEEVQSTSVYHWTGEDAKLLAEYIDTNYYSKSRPPGKPDGYCQFDELKRYMREELEKPEKEKGETENTFIDGVRGNIIDVDCDAGKERGLKDYEKEIIITCTYTMKWNLEDKNEHVYSRVGLVDNNVVSFTVPKGWIISSVENLIGNSTSSDKRTVRGLAITGKTIVIRFTKAPVPTSSPSPSPTSASSPSPTPTASPTPTTPTSVVTPTPSPTPTLTPAPTPPAPGLEAIFAIGSLLAVAYFVLRGRR